MSQKICSSCGIEVTRNLKLCDYQKPSDFSSSANGFRRIAETCDKPLCEECAVNVCYDMDFCPEHALEVKSNLDKVLIRKE